MGDEIGLMLSWRAGGEGRRGNEIWAKLEAQARQLITSATLVYFRDSSILQLLAVLTTQRNLATPIASRTSHGRRRLSRHLSRV